MTKIRLDESRRRFLRNLFWAGSAGALAGVPGSLLAQSAYKGKLLLALQLEGAVDATSFADPKANVKGEPEINRWARSKDIRMAGNIAYAPYGGNESFFEKYYRDILVINGVDAQTNSHSVGVVNNWSGRNAEGFPSLTALFAAVKQPSLPMPYLNFGGFGATQGITRSTQVGQIATLRNLVEPNLTQWDSRPYLPESDWERIKAMHVAGMEAKAGVPTAPGGSRKNRLLYADAFSKSEAIAEFASYIPDEAGLQPERDITTTRRSNLHQQIQLALLAFKAGVSVSADLLEIGFDTHQNHDELHPLLLANVTDAIDYLWTFAGQLGLADRLVLVIGSDFGRTPFFNSSEGKDHWPIGSTLVMERNATYTNKVYGKTDEGHNALKIMPSTLREDSQKGVIIKPAHVHKALRKYLGLDADVVTRQFPFTATEDFGFFGI